ncbi:MAG: DUF1858 domain-containing protein [Acidaminobacteraceae bacterium]
MKITRDTKVFDILEKYGDIASVMEAFGIKPVGKCSVRRIITKFITVEKAAKIHKVDLEEFILLLNKAVDSKKV